jgi:hypothetical protein
VDNVPLSVVRLVVSCVDSEIKTMKKNTTTTVVLRDQSAIVDFSNFRIPTR